MNAWKFMGLKGPKEKVLAAIEADAAAPPEAKKYLCWLVNACGCEGLTLDVHAYQSGDNFVEHVTVTKLY